LNSPPLNPPPPKPTTAKSTAAEATAAAALKVLKALALFSTPAGGSVPRAACFAFQRSNLRQTDRSHLSKANPSHEYEMSVLSSSGRLHDKAQLSYLLVLYQN